MGQQVRPGERTVIGTNAKLTSIAAPVALSTLVTDNAATGARYAQIQAVGGALYMVSDNTTPSSVSYGRKLADGETYDVTERALDWSKIKMIGTSVSVMFSQ